MIKKAFSFNLFALWALLLALPALAQAQPATLTGVVTDPDAQPLFGATVVLVGTDNGAYTDLDGRYTFNGLGSGLYTVEVRYVGYATQQIQNVVLAPGKTLELNVNLKEEGATGDVVEIVASPAQSNQSAVLAQQQNAAVISDGVAGQFIRSTPDRDVSAVVRRASGVSMQDGGFAVVRGLADRYNSAMLNGNLMPSTEPDRKAFALDLLPSQLIDNLFIVKTAAPNLPGEFAGALIQVNTAAVPTTPYLRLGIRGSYHSLTTFKDFQQTQGGNLDFLGIDGGNRALPSGFPTTADIAQASNAQRVQFGQAYSRTWGADAVTALPDLGLSLSGGRSWALTKDSTQLNANTPRLGLVAALSYNQSRVTTPQTRSDYVIDQENYVKQFQYQDVQSNRRVLGGALLNLSLSWGGRHTIGLKNTFTVNSLSQSVDRTGEHYFRDEDQRSYLRYFNSNLLTLHQLVGEHAFGSDKNPIRLDWNLGGSVLWSQTPDFRRLVYRRSLTTATPETPYEAVVPEGPLQPRNSGTFYSDLTQNNLSGGCNLTLPFGLWSQDQKFQVGGLGSFTNRTFDARNLGFRSFAREIFPGFPPVAFDESLLFLSPDQIFLSQNMRDTTGYYLDDITNPADYYTAASDLMVGYLMFDNRLGRRWRLVWGLRYEAFALRLKSYQPTDPQRSQLVDFVDTLYHDFLPSANLAFNLAEGMNLRLAASRTVARPSFREIAPFSFYDFALNVVTTGNPNLRRTTITNLDLRYEFFPGQNQLLSASVFYKHFDNPIEQSAFINTEPAILSYVNAPNGAQNVGVELDARVHWGLLNKLVEWKHWQNIYFLGNVSFIRSSIDVRGIPGEIEDTRPLQGQSDYTLNLGLQYNNPETGTLFTVLVNRIGRRIWQVGQAVPSPDPNRPVLPYPHIWENPRTVLDITLSQTLGQRWTLSFSASDLLQQDLVFYQDVDRNGSYNAGADNLFSLRQMGTRLTLGVSYDF